MGVLVNCFPQNIIDIVKIEYNSFLEDKDNPVRYEPLNVIDDNPYSVWADPYKGKTQFIKLNFKSPYLIDKIGIKHGYFDDRYFSQNNRVKKIKIILEDHQGNKNTIEKSLADEQIEQEILLEPGYFQSIEFEITGLYQGAQWNDTCISDFSFYYKGSKYKMQFSDNGNKLSEKEFFYNSGDISMIKIRSYEGLGGYSYINYIGDVNGKTSLESYFNEPYNYVTVSKYIYESEGMVKLENYILVSGEAVGKITSVEERSYDLSGNLLKSYKYQISSKKSETEEYIYKNNLLVKRINTTTGEYPSKEESEFFYSSKGELLCIKNISIRDNKRFYMSLISVKLDHLGRKLFEIEYVNKFSWVRTTYKYVSSNDNRPQSIVSYFN